LYEGLESGEEGRESLCGADRASFTPTNLAKEVKHGASSWNATKHAWEIV